MAAAPLCEATDAAAMSSLAAVRAPREAATDLCEAETAASAKAAARAA